jgi:nanoRNase/pAp phosphatase (c-di-AMP/oligoRNAs hydrolase)
VDCIVVSDQRVFYGMLGRSVGRWIKPAYVLAKGERTPYADLDNVIRGDPASAETYEAFDPEEEHVAVLAYQSRADAERVAKAIIKRLPHTFLLFLSLDEGLPEDASFERMRVRTWDDLVGRSLEHEMRALVTAWRVEKLRELFSGAKRVGVLLQNDPDPDAMACGLAFRTLVGRNRTTAPLLSFGAVTRPENLAMLRVLDLEVVIITTADLAGYDKLVCVDIQPPVLGGQLGGRDVDAVVDHHPECTGFRTSYRDIRPAYGATATIFTEYFRAAGEPINQRHATALLYGLKTDTLNLGRETKRHDIVAFYHLYQNANLNWLRRIENPEIPRDALATFGKALMKLEVTDGLSYAYLGEVREDVIAQVADMLLQVEGAEWSAAVGRVGDDIVASVRNAGYVRAAGEVVKKVFGEIGSAGGHRTMAKAVIPVAALKKRWGGTSGRTVKKVFFGPFLEEVRGGGAARNGT